MCAMPPVGIMREQGFALRRRSLGARKRPHNHLEEIETEATVKRVGAEGNRLQQSKRLSGSATLHDALLRQRMGKAGGQRLMWMTDDRVLRAIAFLFLLLIPI